MRPPLPRSFSPKLPGVLPLAALLSLAACGEPPPPPRAPEPPPTPAATPAPSPAPAPPPPALAPPAPEVKSVAATPLAPPARFACKLAPMAWSARTLKLQRAPGAKPFASFTQSAALTTTIPAGEAKSEGLYLEAKLGGVDARGYVEADAVPLYPAGAMALQGVAVIAPGQVLAWEKAEVDSVTFTVPLDPRVALGASAATSLTASQPCAYFATTRASFDPLTVTGSTSREVNIPKQTKIPLSTQPGGAAAMVFDFTARTENLDVLARNGLDVLVAYKTPGYVLYGWTARSLLVRRTETVQRPAVVTTPPPSAAVRNTSMGWKKKQCDAPVTVHASRGEEVFVFATVAPNTPIETAGTVRGLTLAALPGSDLLPADDVTFGVDPAALKGCKDL